MVDVGARVEALLAELRAGRGGETAVATAEQIVRLLVDFYGAGLTTVVRLADPQFVDQLTGDPLVASQLILHGLHPQSVEQRVTVALDRIEGATLVGVDADGNARVRLTDGGHGCQSANARAAVEEAVLGAAPEVTAVAIEVPPTLLQIGLRSGRA